jgi:hypothetical protein
LGYDVAVARAASTKIIAQARWAGLPGIIDALP